MCSFSLSLDDALRDAQPPGFRVGLCGLLDEPLRGTAADSEALADTLGALVGYSLGRRHAGGFQLHRLVQAVIRHQLPPNRQQATAQRAVALLTGAEGKSLSEAARLVGWKSHDPVTR